MAHQEGSELDRDLVEGVPTDAEIEIQVKDALVWDDRIDHRRIRVAVCSGAVVLSGEASSDQERELVERTARRVRGVLDVSNDLQIRKAA